jgi:hypothetical protein
MNNTEEAHLSLVLNFNQSSREGENLHQGAPRAIISPF